MAKSGLSILDPLEMWRDALAQWEGTANKVAGKQMKSPEFAKALHSVSGATLGIQQALTKANKSVLKEMNLASRDDLTEIGERLHRIEDMLEFLCRQVSGKSPSASGPAPMPPRTRVPPTAAETPAGAAPATAVSAAAPAASIEAPVAAPAPEAVTASAVARAPRKPAAKAAAKPASKAAPAGKRPARKKS